MLPTTNHRKKHFKIDQDPIIQEEIQRLADIRVQQRVLEIQQEAQQAIQNLNRKRKFNRHFNIIIVKSKHIQRKHECVSFCNN